MARAAAQPGRGRPCCRLRPRNASSDAPASPGPAHAPLRLDPTRLSLSFLRGAPTADPILQAQSCGVSLEKAGPCLADSLFRLCTPLAGGGGAKAFVQWGGGAEWGNT